MHKISMSRYYSSILLLYLVGSFTALKAMHNKSVATYRRAQQSNAQAAYTLGYAYYTGAHNEQDRQASLQLITHAAQLGNAQAQLFLGNYYYITVGNNDRAETWYKRAADAHSAQACYAYACIARNKRNFGVAATYFRKALVLGNVHALSELGVLYLTGKGVDAQNHQKAYELFCQGSACGDDIARANSIVNSVLFERTEDQADAFEKLLTTSAYPLVKEYCYRALDKLAHKGDIAACLYQAYNYAHKSTQEQDSAKAHEYIRMTEHILDKPRMLSRKLIKRTKFYQTLTRLANLKSPYACSLLSELLAQKYPVQAYNYKKQAFEYGSLPDGLALASCYQDSMCSIKEKEEALGYYRKVVVKAHEQNQTSIFDNNIVQLERLSTTYIEAQAQLLLLALWGFYPELASISESINYFCLLHERACATNRHSLIVRLLQEIERLASQETQGRCACFLVSVYLTPGIYYAPVKGIEYLEKALKYTTQDALDVLIECIDNHNQVDQLIPYNDSIITYIRMLSTCGTCSQWRAQYIMGVWSLFGHPVESDIEHALSLFISVLEQVPDHAGTCYWMALIQLGKIRECAYDTPVVQERIEQVLSLLYKAAEQKVEAALFMLGKIYQEGFSRNDQVVIAQDNSRALRYFKQLAALDHPEGMQYLGLAYYYGKDIDKNNKKACELLQKAYRAGVEDALEGLALVFCDAQESQGQKLTYKQQVTVLNLLENIALQPGHSKYKQAHVYLIKIYREGIVVKKNNIKAAEYALQVLQQAGSVQQVITVPELRLEIKCLFDTLVTQAQEGNMHVCSLLTELNKLYFKLDFELFEKEAHDVNTHIRLKGLVGLMVSYMHGRGVDFNLARAVSCALEILRTPIYTDLLRAMLETTQQMELEGNTSIGTCFTKIFLRALRQLVDKLDKLQVVDKNMLVLYNLLCTVSRECPLHLWLKI